MARRRARPALRLVALLSSFTFLLALVAVRLVQLQVVQAAPLEMLGAKQRVRALELPARRGDIVDRNGTRLAVSVEARAVYADARLVDAPAAGAALLAPLLGADPAELLTKLSSGEGFVYLARQVTAAVAEKVVALKLPYIGTHREALRVYPDGALAGQVLGFVGTDQEGLAGLEYARDKMLRGTPGRQILEQDPSGRPIPQGRRSIKEPSPGRGLALTIDEATQFAAEQALARGVAATSARDGVAIVMDPRTGDLLAMANYPPLDPNEFTDASERLLRNRAVTDAYEPGSVNKVITAAAAVEAGVRLPEQTVVIPPHIRVAGKVFRDAHPHPTLKMSYAEAIAESSNIATIEVALELGKKRLHDAMRRFGLGVPTGLSFPGESAGILPPVKEWSGTSTPTIAIGQGVAASPLQVASVYATIANDGVRVRPRLIAGTLRDDDSIEPLPASPRARVVSPYVAAQVRSMLIGVVEHGTGGRAAIPGYLVAGKTGTARVPLAGARGYSNDIVTTFAGMAPADAPRFVVFVALNNPTPRWAGLTAAPVFSEIMRFALARYGVPPTVERDLGAARR